MASQKAERNSSARRAGGGGGGLASCCSSLCHCGHRGGPPVVSAAPFENCGTAPARSSVPVPPNLHL